MADTQPAQEHRRRKRVMVSQLVVIVCMAAVIVLRLDGSGSSGVGQDDGVLVVLAVVSMVCAAVVFLAELQRGRR